MGFRSLLKRAPPSGWIVVFSFLVHLPGITSPLLDYHAWRQCQTASVARNYASHGMRFFNPEIDTEGRPLRAGTEFPLYCYLLALLYKIFGVHEILGRILSSIFAASGALFLYELVRVRLDKATALCSALVMCVIPVHVYFTRTVQPEPLALGSFLGFLVYTDRWFYRDGSYLDLGLATVLGALGPLHKLPFLYLVLPLWGFMGLGRWGLGVFKKPSFWLPMGVLLTLTWGWYHYTKTAPQAVLPLTPREQWENLRPIFTLRLWENHFVSRFPEICATYSGVLFALVGAYSLKKNKDLRSTWALFSFWFLSTILYIVLLGEYGLIHRYAELPFAPINSIFIAIGMVTLWKSWGHHKALAVLCAILILGIPIHTALRIKHWYRVERGWLFRAREAVAKVSRPDDLFITNSQEGPVLMYHINRYGFVPDLRETGLEAVKRFQDKGATFFLTAIDRDWQQHPEWATYVARQARLVHQDPEFLVYHLTTP